MLLLKRKAGERIRAGDIEIVVIRATEHGNVTLGIEAPREIKILRSELAEFEAPQGGADDCAA